MLGPSTRRSHRSGGIPRSAARRKDAASFMAVPSLDQPAQHLALPQQALAFVFAVWPQQAFASSQQPAPLWQHFWTAAQQPASFAQHFMSLPQQPILSLAEQQALSLAQQAALLWQQSAGFWSARLAFAKSKPRERVTPPRILLNMESSSMRE